MTLGNETTAASQNLTVKTFVSDHMLESFFFFFEFLLLIFSFYSSVTELKWFMNRGICSQMADFKSVH